MTHKGKITPAPHLYFMTALPRKTHTTADIGATCFIYWC